MPDVKTDCNKVDWKDIVAGLIIRVSASIFLGLWLENVWAAIFFFQLVVIIMAIQDREIRKRIKTWDININATDAKSFEDYLNSHKEEIKKIVEGIIK